MKKIFCVGMLSLSVLFGSTDASSRPDYSTCFERENQQFVHFENKGTQPVAFDLTATISRLLNPKEQQQFVTDERFSYSFNGKNYQRGALVNPHNQEARYALKGPDGNRILQKRHVTLASGEHTDLTLGFISYFVGLENLTGTQNHLSWDVNERGLNVLLGLPYQDLPGDLDQQMVLYKKYFDHDHSKNNIELYYESMSRGKGTTKQRYDAELIVSLTTWPARISTVWLTIESLMRQDVKPNRIILWLAEEEFPDKRLPKILNNLKAKGLEIRYCENLKSAKKLIPTLREFPDATIITADDDIIYPETLVKSLMQAHTVSPHIVFANRGRAIRWNQDKTLTRYMKWPLQTVENMSSAEVVFLTSGGGTLFPPRALHQEVENGIKFQELCPEAADDIWYNAMALLNNTLVKMIPPVPFRFEDEDHVRESALFNQNKQEIDGNDSQIQAVFTHYKLYEKLHALRDRLLKAQADEITDTTPFDKIQALVKKYTTHFTTAGYTVANQENIIKFLNENNILKDFILCEYHSGSGGYVIKNLFSTQNIPVNINMWIRNMVRSFCSPNKFNFLIYNGNIPSLLDQLSAIKLNEFMTLSKKFPILSLQEEINMTDDHTGMVIPVFTKGMSEIKLPYNHEFYSKQVLLCLASAFKTNIAGEMAKRLRILNNPQVPTLNELLYRNSVQMQERHTTHLVEQANRILPQVVTAISDEFTIPAITIRVWLTGADNPSEISESTLKNYRESLVHYRDATYKHTFWCLDPTKIPKTIEALSSFEDSVEVHSIQEVMHNFICSDLIKKLLADDLFGFASNVIRKELLHIFGGVYNDIGLRQTMSITNYMKAFKYLFYINERGFVDVCLMGVQPQSELMGRELNFIKNLKSVDKKVHLYRSDQFPQGWTTTRSLYLTLMSASWEKMYFVKQNREFTYHGMRLWNTSPQYKVLRDNPNYFFE